MITTEGIPVRSRSAPPTVVPRSYIHPRVLTILGTYRCTAACENCCFGSNPWVTQRVSLERILSFIEEGSQSPSVESVVFSGGECFLLGDDLVRAVEFCSNKGLKTRCVSNGYWAKRLDYGRKRLRQLKDAGLCELNISTGDYHQQWVPQESVVNAVCLGVEASFVHTVLVVELQKERRITAESLLQDQRLFSLARDNVGCFKIVESPWMPMQVEETIDQPVGHLLNRSNVSSRKGCESVLTTTVLTPTEYVGFCCGLSRELIPELNAAWRGAPLLELLEEAGKEFIKIWLFVDGPERILAWAGNKNPHIQWENRYAHHCHACLALFQDPLVRETIAKNYRERVDDVLMRYSVLLRHQELREGVVYG